ncbi:MAG: hypothetical protein ACI81I_000703 [Arcobacteraceae bacterium]
MLVDVLVYISKIYSTILDNKIIKKCIEFAVTYDYMQDIAYISSNENGLKKQAKQWERVLEKKFLTIKGLINIETRTIKNTKKTIICSI